MNTDENVEIKMEATAQKKNDVKARSKMVAKVEKVTIFSTTITRKDEFMVTVEPIRQKK